MQEKPILFQGAMIRAILDGSKTETRRIVKGYKPDSSLLEISRDLDDVFLKSMSQKIRCPYGAANHFLWVRETFGKTILSRTLTKFVYKADDTAIEGQKWKPSIHMPRIASRIDLHVRIINVENVQAISEKDAVAEGIKCQRTFNMKRYKDYSKDDTFNLSPINSFRTLWDSINGEDPDKSWDANPLVWVVKFKRFD